eukprot:CFRG7551T1
MDDLYSQSQVFEDLEGYFVLVDEDLKVLFENYGGKATTNVEEASYVFAGTRSMPSSQKKLLDDKGVTVLHATYISDCCDKGKLLKVTDYHCELDEVETKGSYDFDSCEQNENDSERELNNTEDGNHMRSDDDPEINELQTTTQKYPHARRPTQVRTGKSPPKPKPTNVNGDTKPQTGKFTHVHRKSTSGTQPESSPRPRTYTTNMRQSRKQRQLRKKVNEGNSMPCSGSTSESESMNWSELVLREEKLKTNPNLPTTRTTLTTQSASKEEISNSTAIRPHKLGATRVRKRKLDISPRQSQSARKSKSDSAMDLLTPSTRRHTRLQSNTEPMHSKRKLDSSLSESSSETESDGNPEEQKRGHSPRRKIIDGHSTQSTTQYRRYRSRKAKAVSQNSNISKLPVNSRILRSSIAINRKSVSPLKTIVRKYPQIFAIEGKHVGIKSDRDDVVDNSVSGSDSGSASDIDMTLGVSVKRNLVDLTEYMAGLAPIQIYVLPGDRNELNQNAWN